MRPVLAVYVNGDDALLRWTVGGSTPVPRFRHRAPAQRRRRAGWTTSRRPVGPHQGAVFEPSDVAHFRCFSWTDHTVDAGDTVQLPRHAGDRRRAARRARTSRATGAPPRRCVRPATARATPLLQPRVRDLAVHEPLPRRSIPGRSTATLRCSSSRRGSASDDENRIRAFLAGQTADRAARAAEERRARTGEVYAALFELADEELVARAGRSSARARTSCSPTDRCRRARASRSPRRESGTRTRRPRAARARRRRRGARPLRRARARSPTTSSWCSRRRRQAAARLDRQHELDDRPGSARSSTTALLVRGRRRRGRLPGAVAGAARRPAARHPGDARRRERHADQSVGTTGRRPRVGAVHPRAATRSTSTALRDLVAGAQAGRAVPDVHARARRASLGDVRALAAARPELLVRGVVSELPNGRADEKHGRRRPRVRVDVRRATATDRSRKTVDVVQPQGMATPPPWWAVETTRGQFQSGDRLRDHPLEGARHRPVLGRPDRRHRQPQLLALARAQHNDENFVVDPRRPGARRGLRGQHRERLATLRRRATATPHARPRGDRLPARAARRAAAREDPFWARAPEPVPA